jgi:hypothetical protein
MAVNAQISPAGQSLLDRIQTRAAENLRRLPNYTCTESIDLYREHRSVPRASICTESIDRSIRLGRRGPLRPKDTVRLNVAYVGGKELFGLPGTGRVDQANLSKLVDGPIRNGQFAVFVRSIFLEPGAAFSHSSKTNLDGRQAFRFDYTMPLAHSGFNIKSSVGEAIVGHSGSFWVAAETLDLMRLVVSADGLPPRLKIASDVTFTDYGLVSIGGSTFLLPARSIHEAKDVFGEEVRNVITFGNCREFVGESVLKFSDADSSPANK